MNFLTKKDFPPSFKVKTVASLHWRYSPIQIFNFLSWFLDGTSSCLIYSTFTAPYWYNETEKRKKNQLVSDVHNLLTREMNNGGGNQKLIYYAISSSRFAFALLIFLINLPGVTRQFSVARSKQVINQIEVLRYVLGAPRWLTSYIYSPSVCLAFVCVGQ